MDTAFVYKVEFGTTQYLTEKGKTASESSWSLYKNEAPVMSYGSAHRLAMKFNHHLDKGTPWKYGYGF